MSVDDQVEEEAVALGVGEGASAAPRALAAPGARVREVDPCGDAVATGGVARLELDSPLEREHAAQDGVKPYERLAVARATHRAHLRVCSPSRAGGRGQQREPVRSLSTRWQRSWLLQLGSGAAVGGSG